MCMISIDQREMALRWYDEGKNQQTIADLIGCNQTSISRLIKKYSTTGVLEDLPRSGRPTKLNKKKLDELKIIIKRKIEKKNEDFGSLTTKELRDIIREEVGESYSIRHVERLMHKLGFSLITPRTMHTRHSQEAVDSFRDEFKKNSKKNIWVMN